MLKRKEVNNDMANGIVNIHGKEYMTVARRVELAHEDKKLNGVETEVLSHSPIVIKAKVVIDDKVYTGISSVDPKTSRLIERTNPYEVAETSAIGRALGFAGYGIVESIASADEIRKAEAASDPLAKVRTDDEKVTVASQNATGLANPTMEEQDVICEVCGKPATERKGVTKSGKSYHGIFCSTDDKSHTRWLWN